MFRGLPALSRPLAAPLRTAPKRVSAVARNAAASARHSSTNEPLARNTGTTHPFRWIGTTFAIGTGALLVAYYYDSRSVAHEHVVMPVIRALTDAEDSHRLAVMLLGAPAWARPRDMGVDGPELSAELFGVPLVNPLGVAAGFDKDAQAIDGLFDLGFGYVEIGSVTPLPQPGNPTPRFFRLEEDSAAINRYGFNSKGHGQALARLRTRVANFAVEHPNLFPEGTSTAVPPKGLNRSLREGHLLGVNLGKNKTSAADSNDDYVKGVRLLGPYADVVIINVSSPNTPGLRALQSKETLERLLKDVVSERDSIAVDGLPKIAVKVTCDLSEDELADVASAVRATGVDGVILSNTTVRRDLGLESEHKGQVGGLSGRPLYPLALAALKTLRPLLPPSVPIIGAGGIWNGAEALDMARAGASTVQVYTSFGYRGVGTPRLIKDEVVAALPAGSEWKKEIGRDYANASMGWDVDRVAAEGAAVAAEAAGLGALLAEIKEREDIHTLAAEAHEALHSIADKLPEVAAPEPLAPDAIVGALESAIAASVTVAGAIEAAPLDADFVIIDEVLPPVVEVVTAVPPTPSQQDEWTQRARSGDRRLV